MADAKPYFHLAPQSEIDAMVSDKKVWADVQLNYIQPDWCAYPDALNGKMGCWSLTDIADGGLRTKICEAFCQTCDCFNKK